MIGLWLGSFVWYTGLMCLLVGSLCVLRPMRWLRVPTRRRAVALVVIGATFAIGSLLTGNGLRRVETPGTLLDQVMPSFQFVETHETEIAASPERIYRAMLDVTPEEIALYRTLTWIRCLGRCAGESVLNPVGQRPLLETALRTSFRTLAERPNEELVFGGFVMAPPGAGTRIWTLEAFMNLAEPGFAKVAMNFRVEPRAAGRALLRTETRVLATDTSTRRAFAAYWRTIAPGSALIRWQWLRAIRARAEDRPRS